MTTIRKVISISIPELKPGDILIFRPSPNIFPNQKLIIFFQSLLCCLPLGGEDNAIHAAVKTEDKIAHMYQVGDQCGYFHHTLETMQSEEAKFHPDNRDRPFVVFRPKNQKAAKLVANIVSDEKNNSKIKWENTKFVLPLLHPSFWGLSKESLIPNDTKLPSSAICTEFVIEAIKVAECQRNKAGDKIPDRINIRPLSTPKALEAYLYNDKENYDMFVYPGKNPFQKVLNAITAELVRIEKRHYSSNEHSRKKRKRVAFECKRRIHYYANAEIKLTELEKCLELLNVVMPILNEHSGFNWFGLRNTQSYNAIRHEVSNMGIFERDYLKVHKKM